MRLASFLAVTALVLTGCALPERDNPQDVLNRPGAAVRVIDLSNPDGSCKPLSAVFDPGQYGSIDAASRGRCIGLDATESEDPQGDSLEVTFTWSTGGSAVHAIGERSEDDGVLVHPLDATWIRENLPARRAITFRAVVRASGGEDDAIAVFVPLNSAPVAVAPPPRHLAEGGLPWAPGVDYSIPFRASYDDPDGDPPTEFCWRFRSVTVDETVCKPTADDPAFTRAIPASGLARYVGTLTVSDGDLTSEAVASYVLLAGSVAIAHDDLDGFYALDGLQPLPLPPQLSGNVVSFARGDETSFVSIAQYNPDWHAELREAVNGSVVDEITVTGDFEAPYAAYDAARGRVWLAGIKANFHPAIRSYLVTGQTFTPELADIDLGFNVNNVPLLAAADDGALWAVGPFVDGFQNILRVAIGGAFAIAHVQTECCLTAPEARPGTDEMWAVEVPYGNVPSRLYRFAPGLATPQIIDNGEYRIRDIAWENDTRLWAIADNQGALLLDANLLIAGGEIEPAILALEPEVATATWIVCDPFTPVCFAGGQSEGWRLDASGALTSPGMAPSATGFGPFRGRLVDSIGAVWASGPERLLTTRPDRALYEFHRLTNVSVGDPQTGGVWVSADGPLFRIAPDGEIVKKVSEVLVNGVPQPVDSFYHLAMEPGGALWGQALADGKLVRIDDPEADVPVAFRFTTFSLDDAPFFLPVRDASGPLAWHTHADYLDQVALLSTTGAVTFPFTFGEVAVDRKAAVSPVTGALCFATSTSDTSPSTVHARLIQTSGVVDDFGALVTDPLTAVAHSRLASGLDDLCWIATANPSPGVAAAGCGAGEEGRIRAWSPDGTLVVDECVSGKVVSLRPTNENELLFTATSTGAAETHMLVAGYRPSGPLVFVEYPTPSNERLRLLR